MLSRRLSLRGPTSGGPLRSKMALVNAPLLPYPVRSQLLGPRPAFGRTRMGLSELPEYVRNPAASRTACIRRILTHCLDAGYNWRSRLQGMPDEADLAEVGTCPTLRALAAPLARRRSPYAHGYLAGLQDADLETDVIWLGLDGRERRLPGLRWLTMAHSRDSHSTQHRSEAAEALTMLGRSPRRPQIWASTPERPAWQRPTDDQGLTANH